jgi:glutamyl-tRNA synthetase/glutamyl-Q tRNA(Asp) synthetase
VRTRFAPAPTGYLHLGHVVNALYVWGVARAAGGRVLLRIEDHDRQRSRAEYERAIREDLDWLGFAADEDGGRQSERDAIYDSALGTLRARGLVYACECSRAEIDSASPEGSGFRLRSPRQPGELRRDAPERQGAAAGSRIYPGTCRSKSLAKRPGLAMRVHLEPSVERFDDLCHGPQEQRPFEQCGDLLARDREGNWTYQFAVTVDDLQQGITHVIRGDDLLDSTGRQLQLARLLGRERPPLFLHHPLVMKSATQKLSKADRDTSVRDLRAAGRSAAEVIGEAARRASLIDRARPMTAAEAAALAGRCGRSIA